MKKGPWAVRLPPCLAMVLLAFCLVQGSACARFDRRVIIATIGAASFSPGPARSGSTDFRQAFANFDFSGINAAELDADSQALRQGMTLVMDGDMAGAESIFWKLAVHAADAWSRATAGEVLVQLFYFQSKWKQLHEMFALNSSRDTGNDESDLPFMELSRVLAENYRFPDQPVVLPLELSRTGTPMVRLQINGRWEKFWLDTGSGFSVLASDLADQLHILPLNKTKAQAATGTNKRVSARLAVIETIRIGELEITHHPAMIVQKKDLFFKIPSFIQRRITNNIGVRGILGMNAIKNLSLRLDFRKRRITIARPEKKTKHERNFFWLGYPLVTARSMDGARLHFGLDTGAQHSIISPNILTKISPGSTYSIKLKVWGAGGEMKTRTQVLPRLKILAAGHLLEFKEIVALPMEQFGSARLDGILGNDFFSVCDSLAIDLANGVLALEKRP